MTFYQQGKSTAGSCLKSTAEGQLKGRRNMLKGRRNTLKGNRNIDRVACHCCLFSQPPKEILISTFCNQDRYKRRLLGLLLLLLKPEISAWALNFPGLDNRAETVLINCKLILITSSVIYLAEDKRELLPALAILVPVQKEGAG